MKKTKTCLTLALLVGCSYGDAEKVSPWAMEAVKAATANGWVKGNTDNMFNPLGNATRAELAQIFFNMLS
jgi:hypothetical protein